MMRQLYERMVAEQQKYKAWLLEQPPNVILDNTCKFTVREDIVMELEVLELTDAQAAALLRSRTPLADVYRAWERGVATICLNRQRKIWVILINFSLILILHRNY